MRTNDARYEGANLKKRPTLEDILREAGFADVAARLERQDAPYKKAAIAMRKNGCKYSIGAIVGVLRAYYEL